MCVNLLPVVFFTGSHTNCPAYEEGYLMTNKLERDFILPIRKFWHILMRYYKDNFFFFRIECTDKTDEASVLNS